MPWQLTMLLQNIFASVYAIESRALAQKYKTAHFQILVTVFAMVYAVFLGYAILQWQSVDFARTLPYVHYLVLASIAFTVWTVLTFITLRYVDASVGTLLTTLNLLAVVVTSSLLLQEGLTYLQAAGAVLLLIAIWVIFSTGGKARKRVRHVEAIVLSVIASIAFGIAITCEKYIINHIGAPTYAVVGIGGQFLGLLLPALVYKRQNFRLLLQKSFRHRVSVMGLVRGAAGLLFILSLVGANNASLVTMLSGFKIILTTLLAAILLKEVTFIKRKLVASCIACVGVGLMLW